jgi:hypothetical protein
MASDPQQQAVLGWEADLEAYTAEPQEAGKR